MSAPARIKRRAKREATGQSRGRQFECGRCGMKCAEKEPGVIRGCLDDTPTCNLEPASPHTRP